MGFLYAVLLKTPSETQSYATEMQRAFLSFNMHEDRSTVALKEISQLWENLKDEHFSVLRSCKKSNFSTEILSYKNEQDKEKTAQHKSVFIQTEC